MRERHKRQCNVQKVDCQAVYLASEQKSCHHNKIDKHILLLADGNLDNTHHTDTR